MKTLIRNALLVTMNDQNDIVDPGSIVIDGNRLSYVGPAEWTPDGPFNRTIEADRMIAMPGMVNAHCHSPANLARGMMPSKPLEIWRAYYRASLRGMREEDFYASALLGGMEMLKNGATTVLDHFAGNSSCRFMGAGGAIQAMRDLGLRHVVSLTMTDKNYEDTIPLGDTNPELNDEIKRMSASETNRPRIGSTNAKPLSRSFHEPEKLTTAARGPPRFSVAAMNCSAVAGYCAQENLPMHIHLAETKAQAVRATDLWSFAAAASRFLGIVDAESFVAPILSGSKTTMSICSPTRRHAGAQSGEQLAHWQRTRAGETISRRRRACWAGTDGPASNDGQNMFDADPLGGVDS